MENDGPIIKALRTKGYRATAQRIAISKFALTSRGHPSARQVYDEIRSTHPTVSLATVYKTLQVLRELDLVQELNFPEGEARFDSYMRPHLHLICRRCGKLIDVEDRATQELVSAAGRARFTVTGLRVDVYGVCQKCARRGRQ
jgi:Fur family peroxide stress response transcriptional regulator